MPLENSCDDVIGSCVWSVPVIGFGWGKFSPEKDLKDSHLAIDPPQPFLIRLCEFHKYDGKISGAIGMVEHKEHMFNGMWVALCIRDNSGRLLYNLTSNPGKHNISVGAAKPTISINRALPMPDWMNFGNSTFFSGFGYVFKSVDLITALDPRMHEWLKNKLAEGHS